MHFNTQTMKKLLLLITLIAALGASAGNVVAFPGAEGYGKYTAGGRGGRVIKVTNLNDSGPGSLRAAIEAKGPRIVVVDVDGTIELKSPLRINNDSITIAGQTAPGDGICLKDYPLSINASEVIVRHIRVRPGDRYRLDSDGIGGGRYGQRNVIIDHCSVSWGIDGAPWPPVSTPQSTPRGATVSAESGEATRRHSTTTSSQTTRAATRASPRSTVRNG